MSEATLVQGAEPLDELADMVEDEAPSSARVPVTFAKRHGVYMQEEAESWTAYYHSPLSFPVLAELNRLYPQGFRLQRQEPEVFEEGLSQAYEQASSEAMQAMESIDDSMDLTRLAQAIPETEDLLEQEDDAPVIRLINALLTQSIREGASDIHIETFENRLSIRFRVDGVLREVLTPKRLLAALIVSRIKVMAKLDIAEKRVPQDGRIALKIAGRAVDVRVSTMPANHGERVVLRLLDKKAGRLDLQHLGMADDSLQHLDGLIHKPHGILLVTGPTGSGKTTTLYASLTRLNNASRNILTVEDPIEYDLPGIGQTQLNSKVEMTFAKGLRAMLRQDPDVVMVGEIRDIETAEIAVQASLTGHLVLSTLHTNTAVGAVTRLRDMGLEPFLLASSLIGVLAQRLVRVLCPDCKQPRAASQSECQLLGESQAQIYEAKGCEACNHTGYRGHPGIYELILVDESLRVMIHDGESEQSMDTYARQSTPSIRQDGWRRVLAGETTMEEVLRVTRED